MAEISPERRQQMREYDHATRKTAGGRYPIPIVDLWTMAAKLTRRTLHGFIRDTMTAAAVKIVEESNQW